MPPHMDIHRFDKHLADGYIFLTPYDDKAKDGVHEEGTGFVMTMDGDLVFTPPSSFDGFCEDWLSGMTDLRKQEYNGKKYLTYWNGCNTHGAHWGHRWGRVTFIDQDYNNFTINPDLKINSLDDVNEGQIDVHEHEMTDDNTMVVSSYNNTPYDLSPLGGSRDSWVVDSCFFEVDIETEEVLFEWCAVDHVPLKNARLMSHNPHGTKNNPYDWFHINAVQKIGKNYLISSRHHFAAYFISGEDGSILWKLDGENGGSFGSIPSNFRLQHHVRAQNITDHGMTITMFNNHGRRPTQALGFWVPLPSDPHNPPHLVRRLEALNRPVHAATQGSYQMDIGDGHGFVGYGKIPLAREFGPVQPGDVNAKLLWEGRFGYDGAAMSYRGFKMPWHATPKDWDPVILIEKTRLQSKTFTKVFVSWNGATDVRGWAIFAGDNEHEMTSRGVAKKQGFETVFHLEDAWCVQLGAMQDGHIIRASNVACLNPYDTYASQISYGDDSGGPPLHMNNTNYEPGYDGSYDNHSDLTAAVNELQVQKDELQTQKDGLQAEKDQLQAAKDKLEAEKLDLKLEKEQLESQAQELQDQMDGLEDELDDLESGAWFSYRLFAEVACGVVAIVAVTWAYILWRERRHANFQGDHYDPSSFGMGRVMRKRIGTPDIRIHQPPEFEDNYMPPPPAKGQDQEAYGLVDDDDDDGDETSAKTTARTPFLRQTTGV